MTPLGHIAIGYTSQSLSHKLLLPALITGSLLPDIDFLLLPLEAFNSLHRSFTHSLAFIVPAAAILTAFPQIRRKKAFFLSMLIGGLMHLFADSVIDNNATNGVGVPLLYPISEAFFSPFNLAFPTPDFQAGWSKPLQQLDYSARDMIWEVPFYAMAGWIWWKKQRRDMEATSAE